MPNFAETKEFAEELKEPKYTPGPWLVGDINIDENEGVVGEIAILAYPTGAAYGVVCPAVALPFQGGAEGMKMALANARLIASAPLLLEQLRIACRRLQEIGIEHQIAEIPELVGIRQAIQQAA